jgi:phospholipase C
MDATLQDIEHIVVLMLENRSFDHMLGYLALDDDYVASYGPIEGIVPGRSNAYEGVEYPVYPLEQTAMNDYDRPEHAGPHVDIQLSGGNGGFAHDFVETLRRNAGFTDVRPDQCVVMGYHTGAQLPALDHLARNFTVCDHWFSSVPGATWPNRLYSMAGTSGGTRSNKKHLGKDFPIYNFPSIARYLDEATVTWRWYRPYEAIPATIQLVEETHRLGGPQMQEYDQFFHDALTGELPKVSWIDPSFFHVLGMRQNDDHPPMDIRAGEHLIRAISNAVMTSPCWQRTLLIVTYDEHGGFYDHMEPPRAEDDFAETSRFGVRVPAVLVSPFTPARVHSVQLDHTSIIRTILERFCPDVDPASMGKRVSHAESVASAVVGSANEPSPPRPIPELTDVRALTPGSSEPDTAHEPKVLEDLLAQSQDGFDLLQRVQQELTAGRAALAPDTALQLDELQEGLVIAAGEIGRLNVMAIPPAGRRVVS